MNDGVTLITTTGGRPQAFELCQRYMTRQSYRGPVQWVIVDDVSPRNLAVVHPAGWQIAIVYPEPRWKPGQNTQARNLLAAVPEVKHDRVLIIEDDDWYAREYVEEQAHRLNYFALVGEVPARYYNLPAHRYAVLENARRASLCQTGMRREMLDALKAICESPDSTFVDVRLWECYGHTGELHKGTSCIGVKGLPGRPGIGVGHRREGGFWKDDADRAVLRDWLGESDARECLRVSGDADGKREPNCRGI